MSWLDELVTEVGTYLGETNTTPQVRGHVEQMSQFVKAYTRSNGFDPARGPNVELRAVIVTAAARSLTNPGGLTTTETTGPFTRTVYSWNGFNLMEQAVLNRYRRRTA